LLVFGTYNSFKNGEGTIVIKIKVQIVLVEYTDLNKYLDDTKFMELVYNKEEKIKWYKSI